MDEEHQSSGFKLLGFSKFVRTTPMSDLFKVKGFHHVEFWCTDATNVACRFLLGLGTQMVAKSDLSTGNMIHASYLISSGHLNFLFTAPYSPSIAQAENLSPTATASIPTFDHAACRAFSSSHGLTVRAIAIEVQDAEIAFSTSVAHGAKPSSPPNFLDNRVVLAEVHLYGDVILRFISYKNCDDCSHDDGPGCWFLPGFEKMGEGFSYSLDYGIRRLDHAVGHVPELHPALSYVKAFTGFHEFAEFTAENVGTSESGLNSVVLANNDEMVLLAMSEPNPERNEEENGNWRFRVIPSPPPTYYKNLKKRAGDVLSDEQIKECEELGILVDRDDQGTLLQIFSKPVGDRPTFFLEIIQRVGCMLKDEQGKLYQKVGCGGFGKGNFSELFKSVEEYEKTLESKRIAGPATV
ncbi:Phytoene desaturation 1 [Theobroma cacao]|uniref:4-hydroxyphenylpyruvate dioxygenase n=1 Tax=Theobroma cacao TaxID=3641 RepID=A0A061DL13_THECC|nr:Phytoene desaturation 1 [Theobroma cacao]